MKLRGFAWGALMLALLFGVAACGRVGVPTVVMERPSVSPDVDNNKLDVVFTFHTLPGSPGGVVLRLETEGSYPDLAPLVAVPACSATLSPDECPKVTWNYSVQPIPEVGSIVVHSITVQGYNGQVMTTDLPSPAVIY